MPELKVNGSSVEVTDEGFLVRPEDWNEEVAVVLATTAKIELTDRHWEVINFCRNDYREVGEAPGVRRITKVGGIPTKEMYKLFPGGPGKLAAKLASGLRTGGTREWAVATRGAQIRAYAEKTALFQLVMFYSGHSP